LLLCRYKPPLREVFFAKKMTEKYIDQEKLNIVENAIAVTCETDLKALGVSLGVASDQVSKQIDEYLTGHPGEMLAQTPQKISQQFIAGKSLMLISREETPRVLFHGTMYEAFSLNYTRVVEIGSVITDTEFRGLGLATRGCKKILDHLKAQNHNTLGIATIKQEMTAIVLAAAGMVPASYHDLIHITNLTCTCPEYSESFGHVCPFRRSKEKSTPEIFTALTDKTHPPEKTDCTLMVSDRILAAEINKYYREKHIESGGFPVSEDISVETMQLIAGFFAKVALYEK